ncbi:hypothetical protein B0T21DRAFT_424904 [Apiosordaria backusii]|uniref:Uncharacterized protein n=1 Tax=Apiosordaria backusii TaxID=314023 RepID=A0AA40AN24_9PEZI|nr:hypothetical protein B0T21DRAFT_424904 [Apiosordaria backusii]
MGKLVWKRSLVEKSLTTSSFDALSSRLPPEPSAPQCHAWRLKQELGAWRAIARDSLESSVISNMGRGYCGKVVVNCNSHSVMAVQDGTPQSVECMKGAHECCSGTSRSIAPRSPELVLCSAERSDVILTLKKASEDGDCGRGVHPVISGVFVWQPNVRCDGESTGNVHYRFGGRHHENKAAGERKRNNASDPAILMTTGWWCCGQKRKLVKGHDDGMRGQRGIFPEPRNVENARRSSTFPKQAPMPLSCSKRGALRRTPRRSARKSDNIRLGTGIARRGSRGSRVTLDGPSGWSWSTAWAHARERWMRAIKERPKYHRSSPHSSSKLQPITTKARAAGGRIVSILQRLGRDSHDTTAKSQGAARWGSGNMGWVSVYGCP